MTNTIFEGVATALITPFKDGQIDWNAFENLINWQIESGIDALVVCGTTGEGSTLSDSEHKECIKFVVDKTNGRIPVIAGTGSNDFEYAISLTKSACDLGADANLVVTPYYNKATQNGLIEIFTKIANASSKPIILYNVPSRTGVNIAPETYEALMNHNNIAAIKEANGNISSIVDTMSKVNDNLDLYSGNDDQITPIISLGAKGVISVLSNVVPDVALKITKSALNQDFATSAKYQLEYHDLISALFSEVNPIPIKCACSKLNLCENELRLPLTTLSSGKEEILIKAMKKHGVI